MLDNNPLMTQRFGADPYALVYDDTLYIYMTGDTPEYLEDGSLNTNTYSKINTINVISTKDMVNWTDHGAIYAAGKDGAAKTANNSWAPAATWKMIDGKPKFFLYFANNGSGIFVLTSDSPTGPFTDPLGTELISRNTPTCASVLWLFDPAVFVDEDGSAYIYFGGGVPQNNPAHPYTARVAKLGDDMISLDGDPVAIDPPYLFEDSGIHKMGNTYYYTYSSNFSVDKAGTQEYGLKNGEICYMTSENPMGPFTYQGVILPNPGEFFGVGGNNHHCVFNFRGDWYITYHAESIEERLGMPVKGYRSTHIDKLAINEDGTLGRTKGTRAGVEQSGYLNPYETVEAETIWNSAGITTRAFAESNSAAGVDKVVDCGNMVVCGIETGSWIGVKGVDFGDKGATEFVASICAGTEVTGVIQIRIDRLMGDIVGYLEVSKDGDGKTYLEQSSKLLETITGVHDVYFTFYGNGYSMDNWKFR
ncbi:MAG: family 43 glycosylhydrolase [Lachnospiraceae bacterium]|nr:family 43 glycosylhydrolase [Lachnospiraceae bacterium]